MRKRAVVLSVSILSLILVSVLFVGLRYSSGQFFVLFRPTATRPIGPGIAPVFNDLYEHLGGPAVLGPALSELFQQDTKDCQYTDAVLMCMNLADPMHPISLDPLGVRLGVRDETPFGSTDMGSRELGDGFVLYSDFATLYDRLHGATYVGRPLTQVRIDQVNRRYEQFFENVGFYRGFDEPSGTAHLLPYGAYLCEPDCSKNLQEYWGIVQSGLVDQPFELTLKRLGWLALGAPLTQPRLAADGMVEQVYDGVILYAPRGNLSQLHFRPVVLWLKLVPEPQLTTRNPHEQLVFYEVENGLGHNVPLFFDEFIASHNGRDMAGKPLSEVFELAASQVFRQCFENYCLDYDASAPKERRVRLAPLGAAYVRQTDPTQVLHNGFSPASVLLQVEVSQSQLAKGAQQVIWMHVFQRVDHKPMYLVEGVLTVTKPGKRPEVYHFKPTDHTGLSEKVLDPIQDLSPMSVVEYQVCLNLPGDVPICQTESFIYRGD